MTSDSELNVKTQRGILTRWFKTLLCAIFRSVQSIDRAAADLRILWIDRMRNNLSIAAQS